MIRRPPRTTRTDTLVPYTTLFRSQRRRGAGEVKPQGHRGREDRHEGEHLAGRLAVVQDDAAGCDRARYEQRRGGGPVAVRLREPGGKQPLFGRSEERRVGKECVRTCRSRGSP